MNINGKNYITNLSLEDILYQLWFLSFLKKIKTVQLNDQMKNGLNNLKYDKSATYQFNQTWIKYVKLKVKVINQSLDVMLVQKESPA